MTRRLAVSLGLAIVTFSMNGTAGAQDRAPIDVSALGPQVGARVPDFALPDQFGRTRTLESIMGDHGAMIVFHRSADW